jgi:Ala-tRNA(Pro) deacylase
MDIFRFLDDHQVAYYRHDHEPVFTVEEADRIVPDLPGANTKNLFLRDHKGRRHFLLVLPSDKSADLKALASLLDVRKLGFASPQRLMRLLGIEPGSVSILGLMNDTGHGVELVMDRRIFEAKAVQSHPLVNTSTLVIAQDDLRRFLDATGHTAKVLDVPERE